MMKCNFCANPLRCHKTEKNYWRIIWRKASKISYYSDYKLYSMLYSLNCYYDFPMGFEKYE